ncbi:MAG TPA: LCP family protein [Streptosporangiaceae bacterium]|nr:LCP family protein [Streptosporangiaceae bacterium]
MSDQWPERSAGRTTTRPPHRTQEPRTRRRAGRSWSARWREQSTRAKLAYGGATVLTALAVLISLVGYGLYLKLDSNLNVVNPFAGLRHRPPASPPGVLNILILGSQTRDGQGPGFGYDPNTNLSDNLLLVHLDATHTHATVVSIPRDTMVYEPACRSRFGGGIVPAQSQAIIDGAMNLGGPSCAVATVEHLTDIRMDHFVEFTFNSFRTMVDTLGGVEVCLPEAVNDPYSNLHLSAGRHLISGDQALAFVRTRHGVGDGSDLGRIELQQEFFSSLIQKVESQGTLDNPVELYDIANTATQAVTVDPGLGSIPKLLSLAETLRHLHTRNVTFITMPTVLDPANDDRLLPEEPEDDMLWHMLATGALWRGRLPSPPASSIDVDVLNGTGITGLAARTAASLKALGFHIGQIGNAPPTSATTVSYPGSAQAGAAYSLMGALDQPPAVQNGTQGPITLTLGSDFAGIESPPPAGGKHHKQAQAAAAPSAGQQPAGQQPTVPGQSAGVESRNAAAGICSAMPSANPDVGAP